MNGHYVIGRMTLVIGKSLEWCSLDNGFDILSGMSGLSKVSCQSREVVGRS